MKHSSIAVSSLACFGLLCLSVSCSTNLYTAKRDPHLRNNQIKQAVGKNRYTGYKVQSANYANKMLRRGKKIFRYETFGDEAFWTDTLLMHQVIASKRFGGTGEGISPMDALQLGLKVDKQKVTPLVVAASRLGVIPFDKNWVTMVLLKFNAVVGVSARFNGPLSLKLKSIGLSCAVCHSTTDNSVAPGFGRRLDGWGNRDLNVGKIVSLSPNLAAVARVQHSYVDSVKKYLESWGEGTYDAEYNHDGKTFRPDGKPGITVMPMAYGLAGVNAHTYTGWGSVTYWNAYVAGTQLMGDGVYYDPRMNDPKKYPLAVKNGDWNKRPKGKDQISDKLAELHFYQLSLPAPKAPKRIYDKSAARRGELVFITRGKCASCHVPPLFTEPGYNMHSAAELGIDDYQAKRSPDEMYRTTPLKGLFTRMKGGFYHDGRFKDLNAVVEHYNNHMKLQLTSNEINDLVEYLKSI